MDELLTLREYIQSQRYDDALLLIGEMDEMAVEDKLHKIGSFAVILLLHLIKRHVEQRTTRSWDVSISNALDEILDINQRKKSGGVYASPEKLREILEKKFLQALRYASLEAAEGRYSADELALMIAKEEIIREALDLLANT